jgi:hypothetical protein
MKRIGSDKAMTNLGRKISPIIICTKEISKVDVVDAARDALIRAAHEY